MKQLKNYTSIWNVEKILYAINDITLPFALTFTQIGWFLGSLFFVMTFKNIPPFSLIENKIMLYGLIPGGIAWFMSQKTFDGMKPLTFVSSVFGYFIRPHETYYGKPVRTAKVKLNENITIVRSEIVEKI